MWYSLLLKYILVLHSLPFPILDEGKVQTDSGLEGTGIVFCLFVYLLVSLGPLGPFQIFSAIGKDWGASLERSLSENSLEATNTCQ